MPFDSALDQERMCVMDELMVISFFKDFSNCLQILNYSNLSKKPHC